MRLSFDENDLLKEKIKQLNFSIITLINSVMILKYSNGVLLFSLNLEKASA